MLTYCLKVQKKYKEYRCKNSRLNQLSKCAVYGSKKSTYMKEQETEEFLSNLGIKRPPSKIPLLNILL